MIIVRVGNPKLKWEVWSPLATEVSIASNEYIQFPVTAYSQGTLLNPTAYTVSVAFIASATATPSSWISASWDTNGIGGYVCQVLSGSGGANLTAGTYYAWVMIATGGAETVIQPAGEVTAY